MSLPPTVRVKLSSEVAEAITITPVIIQEIAIRELVEHMLAVAGKDEPRIHEILRRGTLVSGASRFRWQGWEADDAALRDLLATFPDPDPSRPFSAAHCIRAVLRGGRQAIEIPRDAASRTGLFQRDSFWDALMSVVAAAAPAYSGYTYRDRADRYLCTLGIPETERLRSAASAVRFSTLRDQIRSIAFTQSELFVSR